MPTHFLHLLRHAKSGWDAAVEDRERTLTRRGREAARRVGEGLPASVGALDLVLCSAALRTRETAELALAGFAPRPRLLCEEGLYLADSAALLRRLREVAETDRAVMLIGHNPGLHELAVALAAPGSPGYHALAAGKFPTLARASLSIDEPWPRLGRARHRLIAYVTAKSLGSES